MTVYATAEELRLMIGKTAVDKNPYLLVCLEAASEALDAHFNRPDGFVALTVPAVRTFAGSGKGYQFIDECTEITAVAVKDSITDTFYTSWAATDWVAYRGSHKDPDFNTKPYTGLLVQASGRWGVFLSGKYVARSGFSRDEETEQRLPTVQVTARWGYADTCPQRVHTATMAQASRWWKRFQSGGFEDISVNAELGELAFKLQGKPLDPDIAMMMARLTKPVVA